MFTDAHASGDTQHLHQLKSKKPEQFPALAFATILAK
jgi:hypothetical protein